MITLEHLSVGVVVQTVVSHLRSIWKQADQEFESTLSDITHSRPDVALREIVLGRKQNKLKIVGVQPQQCLHVSGYGCVD